MLSGQIETGDRDDEKSAVESLLIAYNRVTPNPLTSIGTYPGLNGSAALIPGPTDPYPNGQLTDTEDYPTLYALNNLIASTNINANPPASNVDISEGINKAAEELRSIRHDPSHQKVLVLVSPTGLHNPEAQAAVLAADAAKNDGVHIFTLNFGTGAGNDIWSQIASNSTNNAGTSKKDLDVSCDGCENKDDDSFFIIPSDNVSAMSDLFAKIAQTVCPGSAPPDAGGGGTPPPTSSGSSGTYIESWGECPTDAC